jgi:hypothetical protein
VIRISPKVFLSLSFFLILLAFTSCKKINEATELGADLIPAVDNINTFDLSLNTITDNKLFNDTAELGLLDPISIGNLSDPEFGSTVASGYFSISRSAYGFYPFIATRPDSVTIDSVVLSLGYVGYYGDTNSTQTVRVFEIDPSSDFNDTTLYKYSSSPSLFKTSGTQLGSKTFRISDLKNPVTIINKRVITKRYVPSLLSLPPKRLKSRDPVLSSMSFWKTKAVSPEVLTLSINRTRGGKKISSLIEGNRVAINSAR